MTLLLLRFVKFVAIAALAAGTVQAACARDERERRRAALHLVTPALMATWLAGYGMMKAIGLSLASSQVHLALLASLLSAHAATVAAHGPSRRPFAAGLAIGAWLAAAGVMVARDHTVARLVLGVAVPLAGGAVVALWLRRSANAPVAPDGDAPAEVASWFWSLARLEALSLVFMVGVAMPLRKLTGFSIDANSGYIGWIHGVLTLVFLHALVRVATVQTWAPRYTGLMFVASLLPFGGWLAERWVRPRIETEAT